MAHYEPEIVEIDEQHAMVVRGDVSMSDMQEFFAKAFTAAFAAAERADIAIVGPPFGYYPEMPGETVAIEAGFPVDAPADTDGEVHPLVLPGGRAVVVVHVGPYEAMERTYTDLQAWMTERELTPAAGMWECYLSDPEIETDPATWQTKIVWPIL